MVIPLKAFVPAIPAKQRKVVLAIARRVREDVAGEGCAPTGACHGAAMDISDALLVRGIPHEMVGGLWIGDLSDWIVEETKEGEDPETGHVWVRFPQWGNVILDVTADQFTTKTPKIAFPANPDNYEAHEVIPVHTVSSTRTMYGMRRSPSSSSFKTRVRNHLRHPPKSCLCHRFRRVDRLRRGLLRRLS